MTLHEKLIYSNAKMFIEASMHVTEIYLERESGGQPVSKNAVLKGTVEHLCLALSECQYKFCPQMSISDFIHQFNEHFTKGESNEKEGS